MKDLITYLKWKPTWIGILIFSVLYFILVQAYVYPMVTFDFSVIMKRETWIHLIFINAGITIFNFFWFWRPNKEKFQKKKPQEKS